jgi:rRNA maturation protein Nop10
MPELEIEREIRIGWSKTGQEEKEMAIKVGINGFGRIGRLTLKAIIQRCGMTLPMPKPMLIFSSMTVTTVSIPARWTPRATAS